MNEAHWHLMVNHLPIVFPLVGVIVMITGLISKSVSVKRTALLIFTLGAFFSIVAMATGDGAEEVTEKINGISDTYIEIHEEVAEKFALLSYILGAISLLGIWASFKQKKVSKIIFICSLVFAFVVLFFGKQTGTTGGEIRHTEIRSGFLEPTNHSEKIEKDTDD